MTIPAFPSANDIDSHMTEGTPKPELANLLLDWSQRYNGKGCSPWNREAIALVSNDIRSRLQQSELVGTEKELPLVEIEKIVARKIGPTVTRVRHLMKIEELPSGERPNAVSHLRNKVLSKKSSDRISSRRHNVSIRYA